jgi:lysophospholipase
LLQSATYLSGLSGGSWLLTSLIQANFPLFQELIFGSNQSNGYAGWLAHFGVVAPTNDATKNQQFIAGLIAEMKGKHDAGFPVTIGDLWARALARHFVNGTSDAKFFDNSSTHGAGITLSGLTDL